MAQARGWLFQSDGEIRYEACKDIVEGAELLVWYGDAYLQFMGIPICLKSSSSNQQAVALEQDSECDDYWFCERFSNDKFAVHNIIIAGLYLKG